jgi:hypothetical protein
MPRIWRTRSINHSASACRPASVTGTKHDGYRLIEDKIDQSFGERLPSGVGDGNQTRRLSADPAVAALPWA